MADGKDDFNGLSSQIGGDIRHSFTADYDTVKDMNVPETITVRNMQNYTENRPAFDGNRMMKVPDKIVLNGAPSAGEKPSFSLGKTDAKMDSYMGGMITPPRTLTVDDANSRYMERIENEKIESREEFDRLTDRATSSAENSEPPLKNEVADMQRRIESLERRMENKQSGGFWKTAVICLLTIINPVIIHWLFSGRRR